MEGALRKPSQCRDDGNGIPPCRRECRGRIYAALAVGEKNQGGSHICDPYTPNIFSLLGVFQNSQGRSEVSSFPGPVHRRRIEKPPFGKSAVSFAAFIDGERGAAAPHQSGVGGAMVATKPPFIVPNTSKMPPTVFAFVPVLATWLRKAPVIVRLGESSENAPPLRARPVQL